jgi:hypothetical protein
LSSPAAIRGTFSDFRLIKGRKCAQIICEIPIEEADAALSVLGGIPQPASERWIALAPLNIASIKPTQEKRRFEELKSAMQAGIRCNEPAFWRYLTEQLDYYAIDEETAAQSVRDYCCVQSRSALNLDPQAAAKWQELDARYSVWLKAPQHA